MALGTPAARHTPPDDRRAAPFPHSSFAPDNGLDETRMARHPKPPHVGQGALTLGRQSHPVTVEIRYVDSQGRRLAKGGVTGEPQAMREAFRQGRGRLALDSGQSFDVAIVAHAEGSPTAYFESAGALSCGARPAPCPAAPPRDQALRAA